MTLADPSSLTVKELLARWAARSETDLQEVFEPPVPTRNDASGIHRLDDLLTNLEARSATAMPVAPVEDVPPVPADRSPWPERILWILCAIAGLALAVFEYTDVGVRSRRSASGAVVSACVLALVGMSIVRRVVHRRAVEKDNDTVGWFFSGVAVVNAVLLAFVVFAAYDRYSALRETVTEEAAALVVVYRDTQTFPEPARTEAQQALRTYADNVMAKEWQSHGLVLPHQSADALNPVWAAYRSAGPVGSDAEGRLHDLERQRHLRHLASEHSLPAAFWPLLVLGAAVTVVTSFFFSMKRAWVQAVLTISLAALLTGTVLLISSLNRPFTGPEPISKSPFQHALLEFSALDK